MQRRKIRGLVVNIMKVVKGPEDYTEAKELKEILDLYHSIKDMEVIYLDDLDEVIREFEGIALGYPYYVMYIDGSTDKIKNMETKELWEEFKDYLIYCYDRLNPGRIVYLGNILEELKSRLEKQKRRENGSQSDERA